MPVAETFAVKYGLNEPTRKTSLQRLNAKSIKTVRVPIEQNVHLSELKPKLNFINKLYPSMN
jgi:hypothetical protein